jgi:hypothetical protein
VAEETAFDAEMAPEADVHAVTDGDTDKVPVKDIE